MKFNEQQQKAIDFYKGACSVIAGAGAGKTSVLIHRVKNLIEKYNVDENDILVISFSHNTVEELKRKLSKMGYKRVNVGTFHSISSRILSMEGINLDKRPLEWQINNIFEDKYKKSDIKKIMSFIGYQKNNLRNYNDEFIYKKDSEIDFDEDELRICYKKYEEFKIQNQMSDFDDWLIKCYELLSKENECKYNHGFEFILVDESQDSNLVQNLLLKQLCKSGNIFSVGDYRQSIYGFRGAIPEMFMDFDKQWDNATIINLDYNYRSNKKIVDNANNFIKKYFGDYRYYSDSIGARDEKSEIDIKNYDNKIQEAKEIVDKVERLLNNGENAKEIAILYRLNSNSSYIENELKSRDIPYDISNDSSFFKKKEVNAIMSYLRLVDNPKDNDAFENIFKLRNYPLTYFSNKLLGEIKEFAGKNNLSFYESFIYFNYTKPWQQKNVSKFREGIEKLRLQKEDEINLCRIIDNVNLVFKIDEYISDNYSDEEEKEDRLNSKEILKTFVKGNNLESFINYVYSTNDKKKRNKNCVKMMTIHASKGLEFKNVFIVGIEDGKFPHLKSDLLEEARLFYVGITRPKENLYLSQIFEGNRFINEYLN